MKSSWMLEWMGDRSIALSANHQLKFRGRVEGGHRQVRATFGARRGWKDFESRVPTRYAAASGPARRTCLRRGELGPALKLCAESGQAPGLGVLGWCFRLRLRFWGPWGFRSWVFVLEMSSESLTAQILQCCCSEAIEARE